MLEVDLTDEDSIIKAAKQFGDEKLDILINCAGDNSLTHSLRRWASNTNGAIRNLQSMG